MPIRFRGDTAAAGGSGCHERAPEAKLYTQADLDRALAAERERCAISETPTPAQVDDACLSYDHSFGLMDAEQADALRLKAKEWWRCIAAAIRALQENPDG